MYFTAVIEGMELVPASAGVIPYEPNDELAKIPCPRIRGGDPLIRETNAGTKGLSPHPRG